jgi:hypothetical protein
LLTVAELEALDEEDAYLAQTVFDHMQLNDNEVFRYLEVLEVFLIKCLKILFSYDWFCAWCYIGSCLRGLLGAHVSISFMIMCFFSNGTMFFSHNKSASATVAETISRTLFQIIRRFDFSRYIVSILDIVYA